MTRDLTEPKPSSRSGVIHPSKPRLSARLGAGLITGASDDDPSGIATYSQAGAQFGYAIGWTMLLTYPLMSAIQEIAARVGRTTGRGLAGNIRQHYPNWLLQTIVALLLLANTINIGADLGAMGDALALVIGGPALAYCIVFAAACVIVQVFLNYARYLKILKWLTIALFAYFGTALVVNVPWDQVAKGIFIPTLSADKNFWTAVVAIMGTTISPYLFFWQASQEVEDIKAVPERKALVKAPRQASDAIARIKLDTYIGMGFSNLVALAIIITTAATLNATGVTNVETSAQAAEALRPVAGSAAFIIFALGIVGTGLLAVPVLAGSAAYALGEARRWPVGLARKPLEARSFYGTVAAATIVGAAINFSPINPIKALYWSAIINGVISVPVMVIMMLMTANRRVMGQFIVAGPLRIVGWIATLVMVLAVAGMAITALLP